MKYYKYSKIQKDLRDKKKISKEDINKEKWVNLFGLSIPFMMKKEWIMSKNHFIQLKSQKIMMIKFIANLRQMRRQKIPNFLKIDRNILKKKAKNLKLWN